MTRKYIIVDDEYIAHDIIKKYCDHLPHLQLVQNCYDAIEAIAYLNDHSVDLIFLDLNMPKLKGFDFLKTLAHPPKVIVTTAYREYALEGYELNIVDYLLKPFSFERFLKAINKAFEVTKSTAPINVPQATAIAPEHRIFFHSHKKRIQVSLDEILYLEASGNYTKIILPTETITLRETLSAILQQLPASDFRQVHRSFVVAIRHIKTIAAHQICIAQFVIPIGKLYRKNVADILE
ncbi:MAG: LytR/AlgR family response regulator transcription factor [Saprospiraceae bacterium]